MATYYARFTNEMAISHARFTNEMASNNDRFTNELASYNDRLAIETQPDVKIFRGPDDFISRSSGRTVYDGNWRSVDQSWRA